MSVIAKVAKQMWAYRKACNGIKMILDIRSEEADQNYARIGDVLDQLDWELGDIDSKEDDDGNRPA